jgi:hypothetical protein
MVVILPPFLVLAVDFPKRTCTPAKDTNSMIQLIKYPGKAPFQGGILSVYVKTSQMTSFFIGSEIFGNHGFTLNESGTSARFFAKGRPNIFIDVLFYIFN